MDDLNPPRQKPKLVGGGVRSAQKRSPEGSGAKADTDYPGCDVLRGNSTMEVLEKVFEGDRLGLRERGRELLKSRAFLIDPERLFPCTAARVAHAAMDYRGTPPLADWLEGCILAAIRDVLRQDLQDELDHVPAQDPCDPNQKHLAGLLGMELPLARRALVIFHHFPTATRRTFQAIGFEGKSLKRCVDQGLGTIDHVRAQVAYVMGMLSTLGQYDLPCPDDPDDEVEGLS